MKNLLALFVVFASLDVAAQQGPAWDGRFREIPEARNIGEYVRIMSARPHHLGSPYGKQNAEWILAKFREWGWDAQIENYDVLFPTPKERLVEMVEPTRFRLTLEEPPVAVDPTSSQRAEQLPSFNAYSIDGDVTGPLVYVNYGLPSDYDELDRRGISVKGAIVIARYGASWRGIKPKVAAERGAIGCLLYSDPRDDGYFVDGVFPDGPMRGKDGVQRGSVMDMPTYPGDPMTPGRGSTPGATRLDMKEVTTLTRIPVLSDLLWRRAATACGAERRPSANRVARRVANHVPHRSRSRARASEAGVRLESQARSQRHRAPTRLHLSG